MPNELTLSPAEQAALVKPCRFVATMHEALGIVRRVSDLVGDDAMRASRMIVLCRVEHSPLAAHLAEVIGESTDIEPRRSLK